MDYGPVAYNNGKHRQADDIEADEFLMTGDCNGEDGLDFLGYGS